MVVVVAGKRMMVLVLGVGEGAVERGVKALDRRTGSAGRRKRRMVVMMVMGLVRRSSSEISEEEEEEGSDDFERMGRMSVRWEDGARA